MRRELKQKVERPKIKKMKKNEAVFESQEKNNNYPHFHQDTPHFFKIPTKNIQLDLNNKPIKKVKILSKNHIECLEVFDSNPEIGITQKTLFSCLNMHQNTILRFINKALKLGIIKKCKIIEGARISNAYVDFKAPDKLETGQIIKDKRYTYYQITKYGQEIYNFIKWLFNQQPNKENMLRICSTKAWVCVAHSTVIIMKNYLDTLQR